MDDQTVDIIVIGGGVGGYVSALRAARLGATVVLVEKHVLGGTCLNVGCIPTKALLESSKLARSIAKADQFGIEVEGVHTVPERIAARARSIVDLMCKGVVGLLDSAGVRVVKGTARLGGHDRVEIESEDGGEVLRSRSIIIATGSSWVTLPGIPVDGENIITSDHALGLERVGGSMVIIGGGAVGCEFAEIYSALGTRITIVEMMPQILPGEDAELARRLESSLKRKGIRVATSSKVEGIDTAGGMIKLAVEGGSVVEADRILLAVGRRPNTEDVGLETAGIQAGADGIATDEGMRTNVDSIFAVGDVTGKYMLAHVALAQAMTAAENACGGSSHMDYRAVPRCVYTDPEFAAVGMAEGEARAAGLDCSVARMRLGRVGRALILGNTLGLAKIVTETTSGRVLGFHLLAPHASELVGEIALAIGHGLGADDIARTIHPHPTLSEVVWESAASAAGKTIHGD